MAIQCNIDQRGKVARLIAGALIEGIGWTVLVLRFIDILSGDWPWFVGGATVVLGLFLVLEGIIGWCIARAMGINTPI
ncbi:MAG: DUF2892 domain-containing protein [Phycisphaerales bacterium]|nr:DUF2892 domain-containing protein [Phycisphaerales bacterium]